MLYAIFSQKRHKWLAVVEKSTYTHKKRRLSHQNCVGFSTIAYIVILIIISSIITYNITTALGCKVGWPIVLKLRLWLGTGQGSTPTLTSWFQWLGLCKKYIKCLIFYEKHIFKYFHSCFQTQSIRIIERRQHMIKVCSWKYIYYIKMALIALSNTCNI